MQWLLATFSNKLDVKKLLICWNLAGTVTRIAPVFGEIAANPLKVDLLVVLSEIFTD
jgi:hypothetical protein